VARLVLKATGLAVIAECNRYLRLRTWSNDLAVQKASSQLAKGHMTQKSSVAFREMWSNDMQTEPIRHPQFSPAAVFAACVSFVVLLLGLLLVLVVGTRTSTDLSITQVENRMWFVYWSNEWSGLSQPSVWDSTENIKCGDTSLQLFSRVFGNLVRLSVRVNQGVTSLLIFLVIFNIYLKIVSIKGTTELPLKIHASHNGLVKQMIGTEREASVSYQYRESKYVHATYQLIIQFEDTSFAKGERQVLTHLSNLLDSQSMADVTFIVQNEKIGAHSAIVGSGSPVICAMLEEGSVQEGQTKTVKIDDIDPAVFKEVLRYLYTGRTPKLDQDDMTKSLFLAADKYRIEALRDLCEQSLISKFKVQEVAHFLVLAHFQSAPQLWEASLKFLEGHKKEIVDRDEWKQLNKNHPDLFFLATYRMMGLKE
jgi:speckle-type POZ protein